MKYIIKQFYNYSLHFNKEIYFNLLKINNNMIILNGTHERFLYDIL